MQADDVRALRQSAVPTAILGALCAVIAGFAAGGKGVLGAVLALAMVTLFFLISTVVVGRAARVSPQSMMITALATNEIDIALLAYSSLALAIQNARLDDLRVIADAVQEDEPRSRQQQAREGQPLLLAERENVFPVALLIESSGSLHDTV